MSDAADSLSTGSRLENPSQTNYPTLDPYKSSNTTATSGSNASANVDGYVEQAKSSVANTMTAVQNSQAVQSIANGPVAEKARVEADATANEFSNLAASRQTPTTKAANGQELTHYHSMFYSLLSWQNPRATGISYAAIVLSFFIFRYVPVAKYVLKALWVATGVIAALEIAGKLALGEGVATKVRPRKYYTIPRENLEAMLGDVEQLINFFVIEFQRIIFAENVVATVAAFFASLITYGLIKIVPTWGLGLLFTTVLFFAPLIYIQNREVIDEQINNVSQLVSQQTQQVRDLAYQHGNNALEATKSASNEYAHKASEMMGTAKKQAVDSGYVSKETANKAPGQSAGATTAKEFTGVQGGNAGGVSNTGNLSAVNPNAFPSAPRGEPAAAISAADEKLQKMHQQDPLLS